jgi:uncharacterized membrane protein
LRQGQKGGLNSHCPSTADSILALCILDANRAKTIVFRLPDVDGCVCLAAPITGIWLCLAGLAARFHWLILHSVFHLIVCSFGFTPPQ